MCLKVLNVPVHREMLHSGKKKRFYVSNEARRFWCVAVRQLLHRMVVCLGEDILPYVPLAVSHLLKDCGVRNGVQYERRLIFIFGFLGKGSPRIYTFYQSAGRTI